MNIPNRLGHSDSEARGHPVAACRLAALAGWDDTIHARLLAAAPAETGHHLLNGLGLGFDEVKASSLVKVHRRGEVVDASSRPVNPMGFTTHAAVHKAGSDVACLIHRHSPWGVARSMNPEGRLPFCSGPCGCTFQPVHGGRGATRHRRPEGGRPRDRGPLAGRRLGRVGPAVLVLL